MSSIGGDHDTVGMQMSDLFDDFFKATGETPEVVQDDSKPHVAASTETETPDNIEPAEASPDIDAEPAEIEKKEREDKGHSIPLTKFLDQRDELRAYKDRVAEYERRESEAKAKQQPKQVPDAFEDPDGFAQYQEDNFRAFAAEQEEKRLADKVNMSVAIASRDHGEDKVKETFEWVQERAKSDPSFAESCLTQSHPIEWAIKQRDIELQRQTMETDPIAYARQVAIAQGWITDTASSAATTATTVSAAPVQKKAAPRQTLIDAKSQGGVSKVASGPLSIIDSIWK